MVHSQAGVVLEVSCYYYNTLVQVYTDDSFHNVLPCEPFDVCISC